eukprot:6185572-Pleurochrysis_carterae.AAC.1
MFECAVAQLAVGFSMARAALLCNIAFKRQEPSGCARLCERVVVLGGGLALLLFFAFAPRAWKSNMTTSVAEKSCNRASQVAIYL